MSAQLWQRPLDLGDAVRAEWVKLRTAPGFVWMLFVIIAVTVGLGVVAVTATGTCPTGSCAADPVKTSLTGIDLGQAIVAVLAVLVIGGEYTTGMIRITLTAIPRRGIVLTAKAAVLLVVVSAAALPAVVASLIAGRLILPAEHGAAAWSLLDGPTVRAGAGSVAYLVLIALLSLFVGAVVRDSAVAIGVVLGLLYLFPIITSAVSDPDWHRRLEQIAPMTAGQAIESTNRIGSLPIGPWAGLGVLALWTTGTLLIGGLLLHRRDA
jgi:ABC-2 type transport system permease protein